MCLAKGHHDGLSCRRPSRSFHILWQGRDGEVGGKFPFSGYNLQMKGRKRPLNFRGTKKVQQFRVIKGQPRLPMSHAGKGLRERVVWAQAVSGFRGEFVKDCRVL